MNCWKTLLYISYCRDFYVSIPVFLLVTGLRLLTCVTVGISSRSGGENSFRRRHLVTSNQMPRMLELVPPTVYSRLLPSSLFVSSPFLPPLLRYLYFLISYCWAFLNPKLLNSMKTKNQRPVDRQLFMNLELILKKKELYLYTVNISQDYALSCLSAALCAVWKHSVGPVIGCQGEAECRCLWLMVVSLEIHSPRSHRLREMLMPLHGIVCFNQNVEQDQQSGPW